MLYRFLLSKPCVNKSCICTDVSVCVFLLYAAFSSWPNFNPRWRCSSQYEGGGGAGENDPGVHQRHGQKCTGHHLRTYRYGIINSGCCLIQLSIVNYFLLFDIQQFTNIKHLLRLDETL